MIRTKIPNNTFLNFKGNLKINMKNDSDFKYTK